MDKIDNNNSWLVEIREQGKHIDKSQEAKIWSDLSIYPVPSSVKDLNAKAYRPQTVSFGPYHHGEERFLPMEGHKRRALLYLLDRTKRPLIDFERHVETILPQLMGAYDRLDMRWREAEGRRFLELMLVDGCFLLELMRFASGEANVGEYSDKDPLFSEHGMLYNMPYIRRDMLMMENQLPLLLLEKLAMVESQGDKESCDTNNMILKFCYPSEPPLNMPLCLHPLDVVRNSMIRGYYPSCKGRSRGANVATQGEIVRSAVELHDSGVRLRRSRSTSLKDISFCDRTLRLPLIIVDDATEPLFLNLMAFERLHVNAGNEVTSYVFFMDKLIDSSSDVSLLSYWEIIRNAIGSDKLVVELFNRMGKDIALDLTSSLEEVHSMVYRFSKRRWNMWRANLVNTYFRSPWSLLSLLAAVLLLVLSVLQTWYTVWPAK